MPFKSDNQRKWMHAVEPEMAKKWEKEEESVNEFKSFTASQYTSYNLSILLIWLPYS